MKTRTARSRAEIDWLPPFGKPEVVVMGKAAWLVSAAVTILILAVYSR